MSTTTAISDTTPIKLPLKAWVAAMVAAAIAGGAWFSLKAGVEMHTADISGLKQDNHDIRQEQREQREIMIRIDENVKQLRRDGRTHP